MSARALLRRRRPDAGTTLVELLVSSIVIAVVLVTVGLALMGMLRDAARIDADSIAADEARAATAAVTRSLSSATLVNPATAVGQDTYLEALTLPVGGAAPRCVQWRVSAAAGLLQVRSWGSGTTAVSSWTDVAAGVVNDAATAPFTVLPPDSDTTAASVVVELRMQHTGGGVVPTSALVPLVNGAGTQGGLATDPVCTEVGRP